ncbi:hypothetical protein IIA79_07570 [bacterium]|nr:hypothetical protein [bacterium]
MAGTEPRPTNSGNPDDGTTRLHLQYYADIWYTEEVGFDLRNMAGMRFSRECRFYFWVAWGAWWVAVWVAVYAEYSWRVPDFMGFHLVEAWIAMLAPFATLAAADSLSIKTYQATWFEFNRKGLGPVMLAKESVDRLRDELGQSLLLRWFKPPESRDVSAQLMTAALWYPALALPQDSSWWRRYGEWAVDVLFGYLPLGIAPLLFLVAPKPWGLSVGLIICAVSLAVLGNSALRLAARRQAILDYFEAWRST